MLVIIIRKCIDYPGTMAAGTRRPYSRRISSVVMRHDCRPMLEDALQEMIAGYHECGKQIPAVKAVLTEPIAVEV
jgi:hypothetical protein